MIQLCSAAMGNLSLYMNVAVPAMRLSLLCTSVIMSLICVCPNDFYGVSLLCTSVSMSVICMCPYGC